MAKTDSSAIGGRALLAFLMLALSVPLGFGLAHLMTPLLWWIEAHSPIALTGASGPSWLVIALAILFTWGLLFAAAGVVIQLFQQRR